MYLVHARLRPPEAGRRLPDTVAALLLDAAAPADRLEHVSVHARAEPLPTLGLYLLAGSLAEAEATAGRVVERALSRTAELAGWLLTDAQVPLASFHFDALWDADGEPGRNRPGPFPST